MKKPDRKYKNRILVLLFSAMFIFISLSPLVPMAEVDSRLMVNSVGIDADEEGVTVTCETINGGTNEVVYGNGAMMAEALQNLNERYGRRIELGHCGLIALGSELKRDDAITVLLNILSDGMINTGCSVISASTSAREFISKAVLLTKSTGSGISGFVSFSDAQASVTIPSVLETVQALKSKSGAAALPIVGLKDKEEDKGQGSGGTQGTGVTEQSSSQNDAGSKETEIEPPSTARVFGSETYELSEEDARGFVWLLPRTKGGMVEADMETEGQTFVLRAVVEDKKTSIEPELVGGNPVITIKVDARLRFVQRYAILAEVEAGEELNALLDRMNAAYEKRIEEEVRRTAELSLTDDFLGFRTRLYRRDPSGFLAWSGDLSGAELRFDIKASVL